MTAIKYWVEPPDSGTWGTGAHWGTGPGAQKLVQEHHKSMEYLHTLLESLTDFGADVQVSQNKMGMKYALSEDLPYDGSALPSMSTNIAVLNFPDVQIRMQGPAFLSWLSSTKSPQVKYLEDKISQMLPLMAHPSSLNTTKPAVPPITCSPEFTLPLGLSLFQVQVKQGPKMLVMAVDFVRAGDLVWERLKDLGVVWKDSIKEDMEVLEIMPGEGVVLQVNG